MCKKIILVLCVALMVACVGLSQATVVSWDGTSSDITDLVANVSATSPCTDADEIWNTTDQVVSAVGSQASFKVAIGRLPGQRRVAEINAGFNSVYVGGNELAGIATSPYTTLVGFDTAVFGAAEVLESISVTLRSRPASDDMDVRWFVEADGSTYVSGIVATLGDEVETLTLPDATTIEWFAFDDSVNIGSAVGASAGTLSLTDVDYVGYYTSSSFTADANWHGAWLTNFLAVSNFQSQMSTTDSQFGLFDGIDEPAPLSSGTLTMEKENWTPGTQWWQSSIWDETDAFHAQFDFDDDNPNGIDWRVKVSEGGGLYSVDLPGLGEIMPPQHSDMSPWNDDTPLATLLSNHNLDPEMQYYGNGFIHQTGMYIKPHLDPLNNKPLFSPLLAEEFDAASGSYSVVNWGQCPSPSVNRADVLFYTKYRHLGSGVIEITFYFYNYGDLDHGNPAVPWTGVRGSVYPTQIRGVAGGGFELLPYGGDRRYDVRTSGGWIGHTADPSDNNSPAYSLVHGLDKHYGQSGYEDKWSNTTCFNLDATGGGRDFKVMAIDIHCDIKSGEGLFSRTYMVMGALGDVVATSEQLVDEVDCGWLEFDEMATDLLPLYEITLDGQRTLSATKPDSNATPIAHSYANPVKNSVPLILMREVESGTYVLSTDPYAVCGKRTFENLYEPGDSKYETYQDRVIYQPYDDRTEWIGLLGFIIPESKSTQPQEYQYLWEVLGEDILFVPGEKFAADELLIWTDNQSNPGSNNPPAFTNDKIVKIPADDPADGYVVYSDTIFGSATDPDGDSLTYSKLIGPAWLNIATDGSIYGTPSMYNAGLNTWSVQVSDGNGRTDVATLNITVSTSYDDNNAIVQWGQRDGQGDIVTVRIDGDDSTFNNVYNPAVPASPSDPDYYPAPASDNRTPIFYAAGQRNNWHMEIWEQLGGETCSDYMGAYNLIPPGTTTRGMVVWQSKDFMPADGDVAGFNAQLDNRSSTDRGDLYWLIEKGGSWYISEMVGEFNTAIPSTISTDDASALTWYDFTPFGLGGNAPGVATTGSQAFITMDDITSAGYFYETENTHATDKKWSGSQLIYFSVTATGYNRDINDDGSVDLEDFAKLAIWWENDQCQTFADCLDADINSDGIVDVMDIKIFTQRWLDSD